MGEHETWAAERLGCDAATLHAHGLCRFPSSLSVVVWTIRGTQWIGSNDTPLGAPTSSLSTMETYKPLAAEAYPKLMGSEFRIGYLDLWADIKPYFDQARRTRRGVDYNPAIP